MDNYSAARRCFYIVTRQQNEILTEIIPWNDTCRYFIKWVIHCVIIIYCI